MAGAGTRIPFIGPAMATPTLISSTAGCSTSTGAPCLTVFELQEMRERLKLRWVCWP